LVLKGSPSPPVFVAAGKRLIAVALQALLRQYGLPRLKRASPDGQYVLYQDKGPCHAALTNRHFLVASMAVYWLPELWPPPYLHPLEYSIRSVL